MTREEAELIPMNLRDRVLELFADRDGARAKIATLDAECTRRALEAAALREAVAKLERFKAYVHGRLDAAGVPADPEPEANARHGCRIEGRINHLIGARDLKLIAEMDAETAALIRGQRGEPPGPLADALAEHDAKLIGRVAEWFASQAYPWAEEAAALVRQIRRVHELRSGLPVHAANHPASIEIPLTPELGKALGEMLNANEPPKSVTITAGAVAALASAPDDELAGAFVSRDLVEQAYDICQNSPETFIVQLVRIGTLLKEALGR